MRNKLIYKFTIMMLITILLSNIVSSVVSANNTYSANIKSYNYNAKESIKSTEIGINLTTYTFNHPASTYNFFDENGILNSIYASKNNVYWLKFDGNMKVTKTMNTPLFYNINKEDNISSPADFLTYNFAGAVYYKGHLYIMYSRMANYSTTEERAKEKVMAIAKYDENFQMIKVNEFLGIDLNPHTYYEEYGTSVPFYTSNCSLVANNGVIACFFGRNMFNGHQSSLLMFIDPDTLEYVSNLRNRDLAQTNIRRYYYVYSHYISHSLGQRIIPTSDGQFLMMESGDAGTLGSTRGLNLTKIYEDFDEEVSANILKKSTKKMVHYSEGGPGNWGYNNTYSVLGNIIELSDSYMYIGGLDKVLSRAYGNSIDNPWNLFVQKYSKDFYTKDTIEEVQLLSTPVRETSGTPAEYNGYGRLYLTGEEKDYGMKWLTDLKDESIIGVRAIKTEEENIVILWEQFELKEYYYNNEYCGYIPKDTNERTMYYMIIDKNANIITNPTIIPGKRLSAEEQYTYKDGKIYWTTTENGNELTVNVLDVKNPIEIKYTLGDVNDDGKINTLDAVKILQYVAKKTTLTENQMLAANTNRDEKVNTLDAVKILQYVAKKINKL